MGRPKGLPKTGGRRKGSKNGKTIAQEMALEILREEIRNSWGELIKTKLELAKGVWVERVMMTGGNKKSVRVYKKIPDSQTLEYLFSVVVGKPKETLAVETPRPVIIQVIGEEVEKARKRIEAKRKMGNLLDN